MSKKKTLTERVAELERELAELKAAPPVQYVMPYWSVQPPTNPLWPTWPTTYTYSFDTNTGGAL